MQRKLSDYPKAMGFALHFFALIMGHIRKLMCLLAPTLSCVLGVLLHPYGWLEHK